MSNVIKVVQFGLGPIGLETARTVLEKSQPDGLNLVGAIDIDPSKIGKDVADVLGLPQKTAVIVSPDAGEVLQKARPHVVLHATSSFLGKVYSQIELCVKSGVDVISSTEELFFPFDRYPEKARELDLLAKQHDVTVLGTGVNPGFVMDTLPLMASAMCKEVKSITVERVVDASKRRLPLQRKIGAGLSPGDFEEKKKTGTFGHIGLRESLLFLAEGLRWKLERLEETLEPMIASREIVTPHVRVLPGEVSGIHHRIAGYVDSRSLVLDLRMYVGADDPHDSVFIDGDPPLNILIKNGIFGDSATVAALVNAIPIVIEAPPGLLTMKDIPLPRALGI